MTSSDESKGARSRDEVIAGEYVLGALSPEERRKVEERMMHDLGFAAIVNRWAKSVSTFSDDTGIDSRHREALEPQEGAPRPVAAGGFSRFWNSLVTWRFLAIASMLVAAGIGFMKANLAPSGGERSASLVAELTGSGNAITLSAIYDDKTGKMHLAPAAPARPGGGALQLWLLKGDQPARSLGVLRQADAGDIEVPAALRSEIASGSTLAVSLEPVGGSPTGTASGPYIVQGAAHRP